MLASFNFDVACLIDVNFPLLRDDIFRQLDYPSVIKHEAKNKTPDSKASRAPWTITEEGKTRRSYLLDQH
jgi:hypothetical protein